MNCVSVTAVANTVTVTEGDTTVVTIATAGPQGAAAATDLTYTAATRVLASSTGADATLTLVTSSDAGLAPASGGGTTNFLRADGTFAAPPGGSPGGTNTQIQFNDSSAFGGDADLTWNKTTNVMTVTGDVNLSDGGTYTTTLQTITPTAARTISFPNATGTVGLVGGSSGNLVVNQSGAYAGVANSAVDNATGNITLGSRFISSLNGAASAPPGAFTGTWFTGGTATTTKPQVLIEPTGATSTAWSTAGTGFGVNAASGFAGNLLDLQVNGTSVTRVASSGAIRAESFFVSSNNGISLNGGVYLGVTAQGNTAVFTGENGGVTLRGSNGSVVVLGRDANETFNDNITNLFLRGGGAIWWGGFLALVRDDANTLAQRRTTSAQTFRVYNTYTSATNNELGKAGWERSTSAATTNGFISTTTLTVDSGTGIAAGQIVTGTGVLPGTRIISGSGLSWVVSQSQTVGTTSARVAMVFGAPAFRVGTEKGSAGGTARPLELQTDGTTRINIAANGDLGFFGVTPVAQQTELTDELTTITHTAPGTPDYAIQNLSLAGYGFVTAGEGNTVLSVIANLQARVNELETKLVALGFLADAD